MCSSGPHRTTGARTALAVVALTGGLLIGTGRGAAPAFYPDDPIQRDHDTAFDAGGATPVEGSNMYDFLEATFFQPGDRRDIPAVNINTMGDVPDSSWFGNRIGRRPMSIAEMVRGPNELEVLDVDGWPIVQGKSSGITPGYRVVDPSGHLYQLKFDPPEHPEMSTGAEVIGAAFYHALGYNVVQGSLVEVDPARLVISPAATTVDMTGRRRRMTREDVQQVLRGAARLPNGKYRALASRFADGQPLGYFKYYGTRADDPNDIHPHEHRRELRGSRVFAAWLNHDDSRALNTLDMLEGPKGRQSIRHYMFDFGSILGSGSTVAQRPRAGNEYILEWKPSLLTLATLGLYVRPWMRVDYPAVPASVGRFEGDFFEPERWKPEYPNPAFDNMQPEDAFWAARLVARFSDQAIHAIVAKAAFNEPRAADYIASTLIKRRDKIVRRWLSGVNPVVNPRLGADGTLTFENAAVEAGVADPVRSYELTWSRFDNALDMPVGELHRTSVVEPRAQAPDEILEETNFVAIAIRSVQPDHPRWADPVTAYFRRVPDGWQTVGLRRARSGAGTRD